MLKKTVVFAALLAAMQLFAADIHMIGDSTMCPYPEGDPKMGWGVALQQYCQPGIKIHNYALAGHSTKSFTDSGSWEKAKAAFQPGDFVVIGMGINDTDVNKKERFTEPNGTFKDNLKSWIADVRAKGATPILTTTTVVWAKPGRKAPWGRLAEYNKAILEVAKECNCEAVDLHGRLFPALQAMPKELYDCVYIADKDYCHTCPGGARFAAFNFVTLCFQKNLSIAALFLPLTAI